MSCEKSKYKESRNPTIVSNLTWKWEFEKPNQIKSPPTFEESTRFSSSSARQVCFNHVFCH